MSFLLLANKTQRCTFNTPPEADGAEALHQDDPFYPAPEQTGAKQAMLIHNSAVGVIWPNYFVLNQKWNIYLSAFPKSLESSG